MPTFDQLAAAVLAVFALALAVTLGVGAPHLNPFARSQKSGFPITRRRKARRKNP